jgi:hypothetical protein
MPLPQRWSTHSRVGLPVFWMALLWWQSSKTSTEAGILLRWLAQWLPSLIPADKFVHAVLYAGLCGLWLWARPGRPWQALGLAMAYGAVDEWHQSWVPGRDASVLDWLADGVGASIIALLGRHRARD